MRSSVDVHNFLLERDVQHELFATRGRLRSPERMAGVLDLPPSDVGKVVILDGPGGPVAAVLPSDRSVEPAKVASAVGRSSLEVVPDARASRITQYLAETIPPAGLPGTVPVVVDRSMNRDVVLYFPGGDARVVLKIRGKDLVRATSACVAAISSRARPRERAER
ncbi:MAG: aminoacyl-tRNA deacylase [Actinomycetota bacterium]